MARKRDLTRFDVERSPRYRLAALARLWTTSTEKIYEEHFGVSLSEWRILAIVGNEGPIHASAIADRGLLEKPHISRLVARLVARGNIQCRSDVQDARRTWLELTEKGFVLFDAISAISIQRDALFLTALSPAEARSLDRLLAKLLSAAGIARFDQDGKSLDTEDDGDVS